LPFLFSFFSFLFLFFFLLFPPPLLIHSPTVSLSPHPPASSQLPNHTAPPPPAPPPGVRARLDGGDPPRLPLLTPPPRRCLLPLLRLTCAPAPVRLRRRRLPRVCRRRLPRSASTGAACPASAGATRGQRWEKEGGATKSWLRRASPSEAVRCSSGGSTPGAVAKSTVWEGSAWSRSWSRSQSPPNRPLILALNTITTVSIYHGT
jgi:hypothetical protein